MSEEQPNNEAHYEKNTEINSSQIARWFVMNTDKGETKIQESKKAILLGGHQTEEYRLRARITRDRIWSARWTKALSVCKGNYKKKKKRVLKRIAPEAPRVYYGVCTVQQLIRILKPSTANKSISALE